jgi:uncharacterized protein (TIGR02118 family)
MNVIRVNVLHPVKDGARFDWAYYTGTHIPMVARKFGAALMSVSVEQGITGGSLGSAPAFVAMAHLSFQSVAALQAVFSPHASEIMADVPKYTSIEPIIQISEVKVGV